MKDKKIIGGIIILFGILLLLTIFIPSLCFFGSIDEMGGIQERVKIFLLPGGFAVVSGVLIATLS